MVTTASASRAASAGEPTGVTPSPASACTFSGVRSHARTASPAAAQLRAIGAPMMPVPRTATVLVSFMRAS